MKGWVVDIHHMRPFTPAARHTQHQHCAGPVRQTQPRDADNFVCCMISHRSPPEKEVQSHSPMSPGLHTAQLLQDAPSDQTPPEPQHPAVIPGFSVS